MRGTKEERHGRLSVIDEGTGKTIPYFDWLAMIDRESAVRENNRVNELTGGTLVDFENGCFGWTNGHALVDIDIRVGCAQIEQITDDDAGFDTCMRLRAAIDEVNRELAEIQGERIDEMTKPKICNALIQALTLRPRAKLVLQI